MGREAKFKQYSRAELLRQHPWCCYCGARATTTDHCPPRALFYGRRWPEGYEFPACEPCNQEGRRYEQIVAVLAKATSARDDRADEKEYVRKILSGLRNNQPEIIEEWNRMNSRNDQRKAFRRVFGPKGDALRRYGHGLVSIGPHSQVALTQFGAKLGKALFYKHTGKLLDGKVWVLALNAANPEDVIPALDEMLKIAPIVSTSVRSGAPLYDQFIYRFNCSAGDEPILYAVVRFSGQLLYQLAAVSTRFLDAVDVQAHPPGTPWQFPGMEVDATLKHLPPSRAERPDS